MIHLKLSDWTNRKQEPETDIPEDFSNSDSGPLTRRAYKYLFSQLLNDQIALGETLVPFKIARDLNISRTTVRQAINLLSEEGWVSNGDNGRITVVKQPKTEHLENISASDFNRETETEATYRKIFEKLLNGEFLLGQNVSAQEISNDFNASLGTVRQALDWLCARGLFIRIPRRGWQVVDATLEEIVDLYRVRLLLESEVIDRVAVKSTDAQLENLVSDCKRIIEQFNDLNDSDRRQIDYTFHRTLLELSESSVLLETIDPLIMKMALLGVYQELPPKTSLKAMKEHLAIARVLQNRDVELSRERMRAHLLRAKTKYEME
ncbi:GntR family transcriptional regulator [uncultured Gimesia sp.]|uniref:GntR family transcriptional regulator n=1 Tax=uncultured Gimesia sp. TaxID=1678688 RepID=UPI0026080822|nr:GntR family transcriptional regulator [uncultured Gimesia sp.]